MLGIGPQLGFLAQKLRLPDTETKGWLRLSMRGRRRLMLTAAQCEAYATEYKSLARQAGITEERAALLRNVARSLKGLASQLDRLSVLMREERPFQSGDPSRAPTR